MPEPRFHANIKRTTKGNSLNINDNRYPIYMRKFKHGQAVAVIVKSWRKKRTLNQNAYYWGVVLPIFAGHLGYESEELHEALKAKFNPEESILDQGVTVGGSTADMETDVFQIYLEKVKRFAAVEHGCYIPDPEKVDY